MKRRGATSGTAVTTNESFDSSRLTGFTPGYTTRIFTLFFTFCFAGAALGFGFAAVHQSTVQKNRIYNYFLTNHSIRVTVHNSDIYAPNMLTNLATIGLLVSAFSALVTSIVNRADWRNRFAMECLLISAFSAWMCISLIFETVYFSTRSIRISRVDGIPINPVDVSVALTQLGIIDTYKMVTYWRIALAFQWTAFGLGVISAVVLALADRRIQAFTAIPHVEDNNIGEKMISTDDQVVIQPENSDYHLAVPPVISGEKGENGVPGDQFSPRPAEEDIVEVPLYPETWNAA